MQPVGQPEIVEQGRDGAPASDSTNPLPSNKRPRIEKRRRSVVVIRRLNARITQDSRVKPTTVRFVPSCPGPTLHAAAKSLFTASPRKRGPMPQPLVRRTHGSLLSQGR